MRALSNQRGDMAYTIGLDYGTNAVRCLLVDVSSGQEVAAAVYEYQQGQQGIILDASDHNLARQNPKDYIDGLKESIRGALKDARRAGVKAESIIGIGVDATGSTPIPVDSRCRPLALDERWRENLDAYAWLWKDHTSSEEAAKITSTAREQRPHYVEKYGGTYSSEWFWSKILHCLNSSPDVFNAAYSWVEFSDYIPALLTGVDNPREIKRNVCAAGHKAIYSTEWGGASRRGFPLPVGSEVSKSS